MIPTEALRPHEALCPACEGTPLRLPLVCYECDGTGVVVNERRQAERRADSSIAVELARVQLELGLLAFDRDRLLRENRAQRAVIQSQERRLALHPSTDRDTSKGSRHADTN